MGRKKVFRKTLLVFAALCVTFFAMGVKSFAFTTTGLSLNNSWVSTTLTTEDYPKFYHFTLATDSRVTLDYQSMTDGSYWGLWSQDMSKRYFEDSIWGASDASPKTISKTLDLSRGTYIIRVKPYRSDGGTVRVKGSYVSGNTTEREPNNSFFEAMTLNAGSRIKGMLTKDDEVDFYEITVPNDGQVSLKLTYMLDGVYFTLYSVDFRELYSTGNWGGGLANPKTFEYSKPLEKGTYYVKISRYDTGTYYLSYSASSVSSVTLNSSSLKMRYGASYKLKATVLPTSAVNRTLEWTSSNTDVVTVNENGELYARGTGVATITAVSTDGTNRKDTCKVTVVPAQVSKPYANSNEQTHSTIKLHWNSVSGADGYRVYKYNPKTKTFEKYFDTKNTSMTVRKLTPETKYYFRVAAYVKVGKTKIPGKQSGKLSVYTAPKVLKAPGMYKIKTTGKNSYSRTITLSWTKVTGASGYKVFYKSTDSRSWSLLTTTTKRTTKVYNIRKGTTYYFRIAPVRTKNSLTTQGKYSVIKKYRY